MVLFIYTQLSVVSETAPKQEHQKQQHHRVCYVQYPNLVFAMIFSYVLLFHLLYANLLFHCFLDIIIIRPLRISMELTTISEHRINKKL